MKNLIVISFLFIFLFNVNAQVDSLCEIKYDKKVIEVFNLNNELQKEKQNISKLNEEHIKQIVEFQSRNNDLKEENKNLQNQLQEEKKNVSDLNKNKIKIEKDNLQKKVDSLNILISNLNSTILDKENKLNTERSKSKDDVVKAKKDGKSEALTSISIEYKKSFDELIISSSKEIVARDLKLLINNNEDVSILNDLQSYFTAKEIISNKYDSNKINISQSSLEKIKRESKAVVSLTKAIETYQDYSTNLKETINEIIEFDNGKEAGTDANIQKLKFNEIIVLLSDFIYNYDDYSKYPYLSGIVNEIISRKKDNADKSITDLFQKL
jgi:hypothetical protein